MRIYTLLGNTFTVILFILCHKSDAQNHISKNQINEFYTRIEFYNDTNQAIKINTGLKYTSIKIDIVASLNEQNQQIVFLIDSSELLFSKHCDNPLSDVLSSELRIFSTTQRALNLYLTNYKGLVIIHLLYAPGFKVETIKSLKKASNRCDKPTMISYTDWRKGLPDPKPPREKTETEHLVIHHSAGSNTDTNYLNTIRNIYLLHTQTNGWDDIGYNFLIAPNGVVFNGRDPQGVADDDNILGAHFCGKNQNTMGVCLLGDFTSKKPSKAAIFSLHYLLAWKLKKDSLAAFGQSIHPKLNGTLLNTICGHRDACSTSCPGDSLYPLLNSIKIASSKIADSCGLVLTVNQLTKTNRFKLYPNPSSGSITIDLVNTNKPTTLLIFNTLGQIVFNSYFTSRETINLNLPKGIYYYQLIDTYKYKLIIN